MRRLEQAGARRLRVGECALLVAEELRLHQVLGQRGAVHLDERPLAPPAAGVERARHVSLAAARLAQEEHRRGRCARPARHAHDPLDHAAQALDGRRLPQDLARRGLPLPVIGDLAALTRAPQGAIDPQPELLEVERLLHVVARAPLHRPHGLGDGSVARHHDDRELRILRQQEI